MSRSAQVAVIVAALAALGLVWFLNNFDYVTERTFVGPQGEARRNRFLAAERLLARMGAKVRHVKTIPELRELPPNGTLLLPDRREALTPDARARLLTWIENGGHLVVEDESHRLPDPILDALEVKRAEVKRTDASRPGAKATPQRPLVQARLPHAPNTMRVDMHSQQTLDAPFATVRVESRNATHLVHFPRGRGQVTVLNDLEFLGNRSIGRNDHAEFLWQIVRFRPDTAAVFVFDDPQKLSLWNWLTANGWAVLAGGSALLAAWLWRTASRFGPVAPDPEPGRRRLLDHLRASGRFQWTRGGGAALVEAAREAALRRVARAHPDFAALGRAEQESRLVALFGVRQDEARLVVAPLHPRTAAELVAAVSVYQRIQERLARRK
jgi:hypothetical protein